jgi:DNA-binding MarR family transcriptional regulator
MTGQPPPPLTRSLGEAERTLRALLQTQLDEVDLSFPEWTTLVTLDVAGPLTRAELIERQLAGRVAPADEAEAAVERLVASGLLVAEPRLAPTEAGEALYRPLRQRVNGITQRIYAGLRSDDLATTQRTLDEIARRARDVLTEAA